jgi:hypothetical protein
MGEILELIGVANNIKLAHTDTEIDAHTKPTRGGERGGERGLRLRSRLTDSNNDT